MSNVSLWVELCSPLFTAMLMVGNYIDGPSYGREMPWWAANSLRNIVKILC